MAKQTTPEQGVPFSTRQPSPQQIEILSIVARGNSDGSQVDKAQVLERVSFTNKQNNVWFIMRYMLAQGRIERVDMVKRYHGKRKVRTFGVTKLGRHLISPSSIPSEGENNAATEKQLPL